MEIVCLSAWKRSGKDTVADFLVQEIGAIRIGFADPLKDTVAKQFGFSRAEMDLNENKEKPLVGIPAIGADAYTKHVLGFLFKELRGANGEIPEAFIFGQNGIMYGFASKSTPVGFQLFHSWRSLCIQRGSSERVANKDFWVKQAVAQMEQGKIYVISDLRYKSELEALKALGVDMTAIRINRFKESNSNDPSERDLDDYPFEHVIQNDGTIEQLCAKVMEILE